MKYNKAVINSVDLVRRSTNIRHGILRTYSTEQPKPFESIPGLSSLPIIGPLHHFLPVIGSIGLKSNFVETFGGLSVKYGPMVKLDGVFARASMLLLFDPELYEQVYRAEETNPLRPGFETLTYYREVMRKSTFNGVYGLTTAQGADWRNFRTKVNPVLLKIKLVKLYAPGLEQIADDMVDRLIRLDKEDGYFKENWDNEITKWSLESVAFVGLGTRLGCLKDGLGEDHPSRQLIKCGKDIPSLSFKLEFFPSMWKLLPSRTYKKLIETLDLQWQISSDYITEAQKRINERGSAVPEEDKSIIEKLLAVDPTVAIMMGNEMLLAGIDTVSFTITTLLYQLAINPEKQDKTRADVLSDEPNKHYLRACLKESLRLLPVVSANLRRTSKEHVVGGYHVPKGIDVIAPNQYLSNLDQHYQQAKEFLPERWIVDKSDPLYYGNTHPMVTSPFGMGVRSCIGRRIAELEIEILLKKLLSRVKVSWVGPPLNIKSTVMNTHAKPYGFKFEALK
ncbi:cytochrome P450 CYP12A2-like [Plodia interpunctella]|uniref:cytochrome P450 CYP12A2-like n=1 Tax=Plodia interpunctella TaxID=58824 RepID=UPI002368107B|nr:cytochrome P450 CYP12A2-like [Plodia interpunctella]